MLFSLGLPWWLYLDICAFEFNKTLYSVKPWHKQLLNRFRYEVHKPNQLTCCAVLIRIYMIDRLHLWIGRSPNLMGKIFIKIMLFEFWFYTFNRGCRDSTGINGNFFYGSDRYIFESMRGGGGGRISPNLM